VGRTHPLKQKAKETASPTDVEHTLSGKVRKPVRRQYRAMIIMSVDHDTVIDLYGVIEACFSAECNQLRPRKSIEVLYRRDLFGSDRAACLG
jgi:hypothetical protein